MDNFRFRIIRDESPENPREYATATLACWHRRYSLGDIQPSLDPAAFQYTEGADPTEFPSFDEATDEQIAQGIKAFHTKYHVFPLYMYDHSGIALSTTPFSCPWDSGQLGIAYLPKDGFTEDEARQVIGAELECYAHYLNGDGYGFEAEALNTNTGEWENFDSCFGFIGPFETSGLMDYIPQAAQVDVAKYISESPAFDGNWYYSRIDAQ
jgi:hypothetical protein